MELDTDADRLETIQELGGVPVSTDRGTFYAIFDANYAGALDDPAGESRTPALTMRSVDIDEFALKKGVRVQAGGENFRIMRVENDGTGIAVVRLQK
jgi:hypothetical protein